MTFGFALSGLQDFLYDLSPENLTREDRIAEGGRDTDAARRLRIRSAILTLIPALVFWEMRKHDPYAEIIYLGGGKLLSSASKEAIEKTQLQLRELFQWLVESSRGTLGAYWTSLQEDEVDSECIKRLLKALHHAKWQSGRDNGWHSNSGTIQTVKFTNQLGHRKWERDEGGEFAKREELLGFRVGVGDWRIGPWKVKPDPSNYDIPIVGRAQPAKDKFEVAIPTYTPKQSDGETILLHELAEMGEGAPYLALLKLDGDGIGQLMRNALDADSNLIRYREVSQTLIDFFCVDLMKNLKDKFPKLYLVYSGGDDMVACGHFKVVLEAARYIQSEFIKKNLGTTVSAGVSFFTRNSPILKAIEHAEQELENAKRTKNAISMGGCSLTWNDFKRSLLEIEALVEAIQYEHINRGALQLLSQLGEAWLPGAPKERKSRKWSSIPLMHYMRSRRTAWRESVWKQELKNLFDSLQERENDWHRAALVGTLTAWRTKSKKEEQ